MNEQRQKRTYTVEEAARELGISRSTAYECVRTGELPCLRFRRRIVIVAEVIDQMLSASPDVSAPPDDVGW
jgi:excisionase family DNA binding protein